MREAFTSVVLLTVVVTGARAQTGTTYRFQADTLVGQVWVSGENARREIESGEGGTASGRIEIWRDGGKQIFILNPEDRTYYEDNAFRARGDLSRAALEPLTARFPFRVDGIERLRVDLVEVPGTETVSDYSCRRSVLTFSYTLLLRLPQVSDSMLSHVEGSQDFCVTEAPQTLRLPFGHRLDFASGHAEVDNAVAARLAEVRGMPVARLLKATRRIENGEPVSATSVLLVSEIRHVPISADLFKVPKDYRFREPEIVAPVRRRQ